MHNVMNWGCSKFSHRDRPKFSCITRSSSTPQPSRKLPSILDPPSYLCYSPSNSLQDINEVDEAHTRSYQALNHPIIPKNSGSHGATIPSWLTNASNPAIPFNPPEPDLTACLPNSHIDQVISSLSKSNDLQGRLVSIHNWLLNSDHTFDARICTTFITAYVRMGNPMAGLKTFHWMIERRKEGNMALTPSIHTLNSAMKAASAAQAFSQASFIWKLSQRNHLSTDPKLTVTYMAALLKVRKYRQVCQLFDDLRSRCQPAPAHAYVLAMRAKTKSGDFQEAIDIWSQLQALNPGPVSRHAYSAAITACAAGKEVTLAISIFQDMVSQGVKPDAITACAMMHAYARVGYWSEVERLLEKFSDWDIEPTPYAFSALMSSYLKGGELGRALALWRSMSRDAWKGPSPNHHVVSVLLTGLRDAVLDPKVEAALAESLFGEAVSCPDLPMVLNQKPEAAEHVAASYWGDQDVKGFRDVMSRCSDGTWRNERNNANCEMLVSEASESLRSWGSNGRWQSESLSEGDVISRVPAQYDAACDSSGNRPEFETNPPPGNEDMLDPQEARLLVERHTQCRVRYSRYKGKQKLVNHVVCGSLMYAYSRNQLWRECIAVISRARVLGIQPSSTMFHIAIFAAARARQPHVARELFSRISGQPTRIAQETLMYAYGCSGMHEAAESWLTVMSNDGTPLRDYAAVALIQAYSECGKWQAALRVGNRLRSLRIKPTVHVLNALLTVCVRYQKYDRGIEILRNFQVRGSPRRTPVTQALVKVILREEVSTIETQQALATALSAIAAAVGSALIRGSIL